MTLLRQKFAASPEIARVLPFAIFVLITALQGKPNEDSAYYMYAAKTVAGAWLLWEMRPFVAEMRWKFSWEAVAVGIGVFAIWVGLDGLYPRLSELDPSGWNPHKQYGQNSGLAWFYILVRLAGSSLVVPPMEEVFYRSFLYRYFVKLNFMNMPLGKYHALSFFVTSTIFGLMHPDRWLAGILCGLAYQWLVIRKDRLGDAMTAHGITNFLLGVWIIAKSNAWNFW